MVNFHDPLNFGAIAIIAKISDAFKSWTSIGLDAHSSSYCENGFEYNRPFYVDSEHNSTSECNAVFVENEIMI